MPDPKRSARWWARVVVHNAVVHPLLPLGEALDALPSRRARRVAAAIFAAHDATVPEEAG